MAEITSHAPGAFCWVELATSDDKGAKDFYSKLFGWGVEDQDMGPDGTYTIFKLKGRDVAAGYKLDPKRMPGVPPHWMTYIATADADATAARAASLRATTHVPPTDIPGTGRFAVFADPQGAAFAIYRAQTIESRPAAVAVAGSIPAAPTSYSSGSGSRIQSKESPMKRHVLARIAVFASFVLAALPVAGEEGKAEGTLTVAKTPVKLVHAYAQAQEGFFDKKTSDVLVLLTDVPLSGAALIDLFERRKMEKEGKLRSVEAVINAKGQAINVTVRDKAFGGPPVSGASTEDLFESKTNDGKTIAGRLHRKSPGTSFDDVPYTYDVTFSAPVAPRAKK